MEKVENLKYNRRKSKTKSTVIWYQHSTSKSLNVGENW